MWIAIRLNAEEREFPVSHPEISVVVPIKDEQDNILPQIEEIQSAMNPLSRPYEILYVDDGSEDRSWEVLAEAVETCSVLRVIRLDRNHGQSAAMDAGIRNARGELIVTMDGDMQNVPADIPRLIEALGEADMVCGYRAERNDTAWGRIQSRIANAIRNRLTGDTIRDTGCSLKVFRKKCFDNVKMYNGMHRFLPTLARLEGFVIAQAPVSHRARHSGVTKDGFSNRALRSFRDLIAVRWMQSRHLSHKIAEELPRPGASKDSAESSRQPDGE